MHANFCRRKVKKDHHYSLIMNRSQLTTTDDEDFMDDDDFIEGIDEYLDGDDNLDGSSNIVINTGKYRLIYNRHYKGSLPAAQYIYLNKRLSRPLIFPIPLILVCESDLEVPTTLNILLIVLPQHNES